MLAWYWGHCHDELEADFQEFYGLNLEELGKSLSLRHAAILAAHLPPKSRCRSVADPNAVWSEEMYALVNIEYEMRLLLWMQSQSKKNHTPMPEPVDPPAKAKEMQRRLEQTDIHEDDDLLS